MRVVCTGDIHGYHKRIREIKKWCKKFEMTKNDVMIILGDLGANYDGGTHDRQVKEALASCDITFLAVHGNHEMRPSQVPSMKYIYSPKYKCYLWYEEKYPNIFYLDDGIMYLNERRYLICGGAYSVDKYYRLENGLKWFSDEQMSEEKKEVIRAILKENNRFDYILSHTSPLNYEPRYLFLPQVDQSTIDKSMEIFLQEVYDKVDKDTLKYHLFGHYHDDNLLDTKVRLMFNDIIELE